MKKIDGEKVAIETSHCGKSLKVKVVAGLLAETMMSLEKQNPTIKEVKEKCGDELFNVMQHTIMTHFALHLLAKTHNKEKFEAIFEKVSVDEKNEA